MYMVGCYQSSNGSGTSGDPLTVFLVRHAEKVDQSRDPDLSMEGYRRASELARVLADADIERIFSSDFIRTRETASPLAEALDLRIELYDPRDLYTLAEQLKKDGGRHLVVGHSNTTPALVEILGGDPGSPIIEEYEYDRLYVVSFTGNEVITVLLRYGEFFSSAPSNSRASSLLVPHTSGSALN
jgi:broad specificity phosphatase PhoE